MWYRRRKTVRAREFILEDAEGEERAALRTDSENTVLQFKDAHGNVRMLLQLAADGTSQITLKYANGRGSIMLEANDIHNCAGIRIAGSQGSAQVVLGMTGAGEPTIGLVGEDGKVLFRQVGSATPARSLAEFDWDSILRG